MDIQDVVTEYGAYYQDRGQNISRLYQVLRRKLASESMFTTQLTDDTIWQAGKVSFGRLVQAYQKGFTPINPLAFDPVQIKMFHHKVDTSETPHDLEASWLGFLADNNVSPKDWPFVRWWIEQQIVNQIEDDMETLEIGKGVRVEPTAGVVGAAGAGMDGFLTIIKQHIAGTRTTPITMGVVPTDEVEMVEYVEDLCDQIDEKYWSQPMELNMNERLKKRYRRGLRKVYGKDTVDNALNDTVKDTNITIVGRASMQGKSRIFCTPKDNSIVLKKKTQNQKRFDVQADKRQVNILTDWWYGVGFILPELIFCNDQE
ncbi:hypothetical protein [Spirosoma oryzicola]|uniref:hypothetical protein n=1 Tax=Spirosoma oryzicola TaxID=2898794 RepID=UPI001E56E681|nr:hypothetical protein [Spirosoma oryzicola]UHG93448.1 hypothetical protein LQ777_11200 [Spirosoma oryzicola]